MATRNVTLVKLATTKPGTRVHAWLHYDEGRKDDYRPRARGFYLHVVTEEVEGGYVTVVPSPGGFCLVESASRFNQRRFDALSASLVETPQFRNVIERVLERNGLALLDEDEQVLATAEPSLANA